MKVHQETKKILGDRPSAVVHRGVPSSAATASRCIWNCRATWIWTRCALRGRRSRVWSCKTSLMTTTTPCPVSPRGGRGLCGQVAKGLDLCARHPFWVVADNLRGPPPTPSVAEMLVNAGRWVDIQRLVNLVSTSQARRGPEGLYGVFRRRNTTHDFMENRGVGCIDLDCSVCDFRPASDACGQNQPPACLPQYQLGYEYGLTTTSVCNCLRGLWAAQGRQAI